MGIGIDNLLAAVLLSLIMLRRLELRTAQPEFSPHVPRETFESWRKLLLSAYDIGAAGCALKVALTLGWQWATQHYGIGDPWYRLVPAGVFVAWVVVLVSVWRRVSDLRGQQERLAIVLRRPAP